MGTLRQLKKRKENPSPSPLNPTWYHGFNAGSKKQRESDIKFLIQVMENLEQLPGIGEKTADKIREMVMNRFGGNRD